MFPKTSLNRKFTVLANHKIEWNLWLVEIGSILPSHWLSKACMVSVGNSQIWFFVSTLTLSKVRNPCFILNWQKQASRPTALVRVWSACLTNITPKISYFGYVDANIGLNSTILTNNLNETKIKHRIDSIVVLC